ncbi:ATP synthase subunit I [Piscinibacter sakaiensis]|uniref:ATP synthase subunit I n=1 Tax=Piscinibacter sakaiensis TaxID=1547922 RepID=UPI0006B59219
MNRDRRDVNVSFDDAADERPFKTLTADEARRVREKLTMVSPWRVVGVQLLVGVVCVAGAWLLTGKASTAWSALYGAAATVVPNALMARGMTRGARSAVSAAAGFLFWEMLKIGVAIAMLLIAARVVPQLSWPALLLTMLVCIKVNWFALLWRGRRGT